MRFRIEAIGVVDAEFGVGLTSTQHAVHGLQQAMRDGNGCFVPLGV
jgi:hypothetical protein